MTGAQLYVWEELVSRKEKNQEWFVKDATLTSCSLPHLNTLKVLEKDVHVWYLAERIVWCHIELEVNLQVPKFFGVNFKFQDLEVIKKNKKKILHIAYYLRVSRSQHRT